MDRTMIRFVRNAVCFGALAMGIFACAAAPTKSSSDKDNSDTDTDQNEPSNSSSSVTPTPPSTVNTTAPTITLINPTSVPIALAGTAIGTTVTVTGTNFAPAARAAINGTPLTTGVTVTSATSMSIMIPPQNLTVAATLNITVLSGSPEVASNAMPLAVGTGGGQQANGALTMLSPTSAARGASFVTLSVFGNGFDNSSTIVFNNSDVQTQFVNATTLSTTIPGSLLQNNGTVQVQVRRAGVIVGSLPFTVGSGTGTNPGFCSSGQTCNAPNQCFEQCNFQLGPFCVDSTTFFCDSTGCLVPGGC